MMNAQEKFTNELIYEDSPYLQQHAHNPVDWYAWGDKAFKKAKEEKKLIFLSIGYSTCHWCHVMEKESFENEEVAKVLNKHFISIKVDREEMPHVDKYYQDVYNLLNNRAGGWPLNIILTPERKAFYAATYIPNISKYGRMGIIDLLNKLADVYKYDSLKVVSTSLQIESALKEYKSAYKGEKRTLSLALVDKFVEEVEKSFDTENPGIGTAPKFPHAATIETLLDIYVTFENDKALEMATSMLKSMGNGGIYDQIEGGFYRYSVDEEWMIPHFEKMLYTNAELLGVYAKAYRITKDEFFKKIVDELISFTKIRFEDNNLLYSASDADSQVGSEKEEGAYFVFDYTLTSDFLKENGYKNKE
ncbi:MAG: thioredoxin domain-containing protein, partial [Campylobacteraceae bacterium]|nr:thioredoxin domain-containing protein [Campylobacteraceae bacterium]